LVRKYKTLENAFKKIDDNDSGALSMEELKKSLGTNYKASEVGNRVFRYIDCDNSGILDKHEFVGLQKLNSKTFIKELRKLQERGSWLAAKEQLWLQSHNRMN
jgi:Ca2+-binding EF-hand superfamily protein